MSLVAMRGIVLAVINARDGFALHGCYALDSASNLVGGANTVYPLFYKLESQYLEVRDGAGTTFMCYADQNVGNRLGQSAPKIARSSAHIVTSSN
ncbi:uncharacterized protein PGTG_18268 [Puccinia graminis f. sp. tritici CRL 75-36-700-3]|uniref:Uncharacterized protein n=1 Tax=Puccinia graminis f. sp. tritici (strain CRL 75-36-700-3 / race SCCL) TaxID=418459 RepID=E3L7B8_PUCGT|nr:uncharacterized protein PGTG_18268 [Puccinia graminis f. sp. tritici CRL 75-36-700-3]EFP92443.2 hypothetical protein PGTG_18268 [Puccinia graminis f. sp. tritici CRL 75-36-700-3]